MEIEYSGHIGAELKCGECYYNIDFPDDIYYVAHIFDTDFSKFEYYYLIDIQTGESICKCDTLEELNGVNSGLIHLVAKLTASA